MRGNKGLNGRNTDSLNFWQKRLLDHSMTLHSIADAIGVSYRYTVAYFTGFVHPKEPTIKSICDILEVPIDLGTLEFDKLFESWGNAHKDTYAKFGNTYRRINKSASNSKKSASNSKKSHNKMNFWQHKISGQGMSTKELSIFLDKPYSTVKAYFSGFVMPSKDIIIALCKKFNVDYDRAYSEFEKIHSIWGETHADTYVVSGNCYKIKDTQSHKLEVSATPKDDQAEYLRVIYGKLSYDDFMLMLTSGTNPTDVLRLSYGKVDSDTFMSLLR